MLTISYVDASFRSYDFEVAVSTDVGTVVVYCYAEWHASSPSMMLQYEE